MIVAGIETGSIYGRLQVIGFEKHPDRMWATCRCECGTVRDYRIDSLRRGHSRSCGCLCKEVSHRINLRHGGFGSRLYRIWVGMKKRCHNPKDPAYPRYGARGISVCEDWRGPNAFDAFQAWSMANGYSEDKEIDRIDNDGCYEPGNCRWTTKKINANNREATRLATAWGETKALALWAEDPRCLVSHSALKNRLDSGWDAVRALTTPNRIRSIRTRQEALQTLEAQP